VARGNTTVRISAQVSVKIDRDQISRLPSPTPKVSTNTYHSENYRETLPPPLPWSTIQGPNPNTKFVAGAADAEYRDCSVLGASRELKAAAVNTFPE
jgi:hypothetical protein